MKLELHQSDLSLPQNIPYADNNTAGSGGDQTAGGNGGDGQTYIEVGGYLLEDGSCDCDCTQEGPLDSVWSNTKDVFDFDDENKE